MVKLYKALSEKDRRRYAAVEAEKLGRGGVRYIADLFGCNPDTIRHGAADIEQLPHDEAAAPRPKKGEAANQLASRSPNSFLPWKH